ncbi:unnamed protein product [Microthlaspi erraticum]|uniref:F-box domain-containing protein n=1 Tax=Microthlaspi erraticum TaxID=1685480 RepID=A0A6D2HV52_9BRAS|nr:unnamed protein product [Microthlaspi erraticum]
MALGKKRLGAAKSSSNSNRNVVGDGGLGLGLEFVKHKKRFGRKRVLNSGGKIQDSRNICKKSVSKTRELEALPQDILIRIICGVEHGDLKQLFNVSKTIREATLIAKKWHFEYSTPRKTLFFRGGFDSMIDTGDEMEVPLLKKYRRSRITGEKKVSKISVALFK